jgi:hypothetical protein
MTIDMTNNRVPYGLLTDEEKAALHDHQKAGGSFLYTLAGDCWVDIGRKATWNKSGIYRPVPLPEKTQDVIAWDWLPDRIEWVARWENGMVWGYVSDPSLQLSGWHGPGGIRIDDFPSIVQIGTCDWRDSKQTRPRG